MSTGRHLVLVVEDDPTVRGLLTELLSSAGYEVVAARDGLEGLVKLEARNPALLVLDIVMPDVSGERLLEEMRADERLRGVPVIVVSGLPDAHRRFDEVVGRENVVRKPFDPDALLRRVGTLLGARA
jgi:chemosensory pili system protein ChpA (sensor histidine kinase/response regulator)